MDFKKANENEETNNDMIAEKNTEKGILGRFRNSELGKTLLGEDGVFNTEDMERIAESAREAVRNAAESVMEVKRQIHTDTQEIRQAANDARELHDVEKEIRQSREQAETAYQDTVRQMKHEVEQETKELKELLKEDGSL
jgi:hypothetical protein